MSFDDFQYENINEYILDMGNEANEKDKSTLKDKVPVEEYDSE